MKVLDVAEFYAEKGGGVKTYIDHKLRAGSALGHEVVVVAPAADDGEEARLGGRVVWVKSPPVPGDPRYHLFVRPRTVHRILEREAPDVIEGSSVYGGGWSVARWRGSGLKSLIFHQDPVAVFGHSFFDRYVSTRRIDRAFGPVWSYLRSLSSRFDTTVVAGEWLRDRLASFSIPRVAAVPFGIDAGPFARARPDRTLRAKLLVRAKVPRDAPLLVTVSRHHPEKRLPTLIEAVAELNRGAPTALAIYGDGPQRARIEALARKVPQVVVAGYTRNREELAQAVATGDALLHGSAAETYGLVVAEAMAAGLPIVVPSVGGAADLADPAFAETYSPGDAMACAGAVRRLLVRDIASMRAVARDAARHRVRTLDQHFEHLFRHYAELVAGLAPHEG